MNSNNIEFSEYSDDEQELIQKGYIAAMRDVADGCFEVIGEMEDSPHTDGVCETCGSELIREMGREGKFCPTCEGD